MPTIEKPVIEPKLPPQYVRAEQLLQILFAEDARPSLRWLRTAQQARQIPSVRIGRLIFFEPEIVRTALNSQALRRVKI